MTYPNQAKDVFRSINMEGGKDACWPFKGKLNGKGRPYFTVAGKKYLAYRLAYELVNGDSALEGVLARHICDNEICCNPHHIIPGDQQQNMNDLKQRQRHGLPHHTIRAIRKLGDTPNGPTHAEIAELYGIGRSTVTEIINKSNYSHVTETGTIYDEESLDTNLNVIEGENNVNNSQS